MVIPYLVLAHGTFPTVRIVVLSVTMMYSEARISDGRAV